MNQLLAINAQYPALFSSRAIATNQVGYEAAGPKFAVLALGGGPDFIALRLRDAATGEIVFETTPAEATGVDNWKPQRWQGAEFTAFTGTGSFLLEALDATGARLVSEPFEIAAKLYAARFPAALLGYFHSQRTAEPYLGADRAVGFIGNKRNARADVHGGWYDASGDVSKYLSHLSYANFMNPQQTPLVVWALSKAAICPHIDKPLHADFRAEALWGADFLVRMCDPAGMFYMTVFDRWSGESAQREICSYSTQKGHKHDSWEAGYRQGGGMAIAALARAARLKQDGEFTAAQYLATAERAFAHLDVHNLEYLDNGEENIIDDYCALLAATELSRSTGKPEYLVKAGERATSLLDRLTGGHGYDGWWRADNGTRPFFHASDEGLPIAALVDYLAIAPEADKARVSVALGKVVRHLAGITAEVANPFAYPRQLVRRSDGEIGTQFFYPHGNDSGYWWQGENARLGSLAYALRRAMPHIDAETAELARVQSQRALDWILGLNPYHASMLQGFGRNWAIYGPTKFPNADGGICNGITSSLSDETAIGFCETEDPFQSWRWSEQWLPHAAWFLLAMTEY
ncbi:MAG TPA: glycoside hydrolase family 9 protein [Devosia sp.]|jgi:hypothetical protein|uniref:glycoside hydrolase family 9 protein n=1 Tax=Devosia sp. TaxID=1871048 RepID=UPI002DDD88DD|nr:glycoside hydrolase family 9 protein [Devosia sp.]HEV2517848.1 glycoside hydrolase family 9 protein [Devosia sp.]